MNSLQWGIKSSLLRYVQGMPDGTIEVSRGAAETAEGFVFPATFTVEGELSFRGTVTLTGHGGMLHLPLSDPALVAEGAGWALTIADPDNADERLQFARAGQLIETDRGLCAVGTVLTSDGADLFFGPYVAGTPLDDPCVRRSR